MKATLSYLLDHPKYDQEKPYELWLPEEELAGADLPSTNCEFEERSDITIQDVRTSNLSFAFDTTGFKFVSDPLDEDYHCAGLLFKKDSTLERYLKQTVGLIKREFGTEKVICFDWRYRKAQASIRRDNQEYEIDRGQPLRPAHIAHQDDSVEGGKDRLKRHLTEDELRACEDGTRARFVNVWRPLVAAVEDMPLALCDRRTVENSDLVECDKIHPDRIGEGIYLKHRRSHMWYWLSHQTRDEPTIFITWDSKADGHPAGPPHIAFRNPSSRAEAPPRESIEVRLIVLT